MQTLATPPLHTRAVEYDALRHRLWILGQRCHHGATGALIAGGAVAGAALGAVRLGRVVALASAGTLLMAHDWKDRSIWFQRGRQAQP